MRAGRLRTVFSRWHLAPGWAAVAMVLTVVLNLWSVWAADTDFFLPNPFAWLSAYLLLVFVVSGWIRSRYGRAMTRLTFGVIPIVLLLGAEVWSNVQDRGSFPRILRVDDPILRYQYRPHAEGINDLGIADLTHTLEKPAGVFRVVLLGDSVPNDMTIPVEQRFQTLLEERLNASPPAGRRYEVINVSCSGYNTEQEVRLFERVGVRYQPDFVLVAYVLNDPFLQDGSHQRIGNSFFAFRFIPLYYELVDGDQCRLFAAVATPYAFARVVDQSFERLALLSKMRGFGVAVASLPIVAPFDDPVCGRLYDQVGAAAGAHGIPFFRVVDAFRGEDPDVYRKPHDRFDVTHPTAAGHRRIADYLAKELAPLLAHATSPSGGQGALVAPGRSDAPP